MLAHDWPALPRGKNMFSKKVLRNTKWIVICKAAQSILQMIIGMISARYLGPANYGLIGYAKSVTAFAFPLMRMGLDGTLVKELTDTPEQEGKIMGTALVMNLVSGLFCMVLVASFVFFANPGETVTLIVCILYSLSLLFQALELMQYWFQYKLESKYPSIVMLCAYVVVSVYKIYLLIAQKSVYWFALVNSIDYAIIGISLFCIYRRMGAQKLSFSFSMVKRLFSSGRYFILATMMVMIFQNTDHIMLKMMSGDAENGFYTAAITSVIVCQFLYTAIVDSMRPVILEAKKHDSAEYEKNVAKLYSVTTYMAIAQAIGFTLFARLIIQILYGQEYITAVPVLQIIVWQVSFSFMGTVRNILLLAEGMERIIWKLNLTGAILNAVINYLMIPRWGACGAACASLLTQIFTNFVLGFVVPELKENNRLLLKGLNPKLLREIFRR